VSQVDDYFEVLLYYPTLRVRLHSSYLVREALPGYSLHGTKGSFIKSKTNVQEEALNEGRLPVGEDWGVEPEVERGLLHTEKNGQGIRVYITSEKGAYADYFTALYAAVKDGGSAPVSAEDGLAVIRIIEAAFESNRQQRVIHL
jgi:predicted dehydrogenase